MATKREIKKRIGAEFRKLQEDIARYVAISKDESIEKAKQLISETAEAQRKFGSEINAAVDQGKDFYKDMVTRAVNDIDEKYNRLKDLIEKK